MWINVGIEASAPGSLECTLEQWSAHCPSALNVGSMRVHKG